MKYSVTLLLFCLLFSVTLGQDKNTKELGKLNFNGNAEWKLSATVQKGQFTYTLTDLTKPDSPIFSFELIDNTLENFKKNIISRMNEEYKVSDEKELEKYFYFFVNQNIFLIENENGGKAMDMKFNDSLEIYSFKHPDFSTIKPDDIYFLLKELFSETKLGKEHFKNPNDYFSYKKYEIFKLNNIEQKSAKNGKNTSGNQSDTVFDHLFEARLEKINTLKPKAVKWEELYKEINYRYYNALIERMRDTLGKDNKANFDSIKKFDDSIKVASRNLQVYVNDSISLSKKQTELQSDLNKIISRIDDQRKKIPSDFEIYTINDENSTDSEENDLLKNKIEKNIDKLNTAKVEIKKRSLPNSDLKESEKLINDDFIKIEDIFKNYLELASAELTKNLLVGEIERSNNGSSLVFNRPSAERSKIDSLNSEKNKLQKQNEEKVKNHLEELNKSNKYQFKAEKIQLEVNRGYLENIIVLGKASIFVEKDFKKYVGNISAPTYSLKFINDYPIGISAKKDIERISNIKLYARFENNTHYELRLGDLISNVEEILALDRRDYSPKDDDYTVDLGKEKIKEFYKPDTKELFELKIFSDFVGINESSPNGLIQLEVDKEIPLVTKRITRSHVWVPVRFLVNKHSNLGFFNFIKPQFILSKIEEDQRALEVSQFNENNVVQYGVSTLDLKQFERFSIGTDLNLLLYNIPYAKSTFLLNGGIHFGRTDLTDSTGQVNEFPRSFTNTIQPSLDLLWRINGDERYGFELSYGINWVFSDELFFTQRAQTFGYTKFEEFEKSEDNSKLGRFTLLAYLNLSKESAGRLFFRYRFNSELGDFTNNYSQLQVGYTTFLTKREN